jgi:hypothetical protein
VVLIQSIPGERRAPAFCVRNARAMKVNLTGFWRAKIQVAMLVALNASASLSTGALEPRASVGLQAA